MSDVLSTLVELNIRHGGGARIDAIRDWLDRQRADAIALTDPGDLTDLWRHSHGEDAREWTWHAATTGNGFRIDHALGNAALLARYPRLRCRYDHSTRETGLTDHSALVVELDPPA